MVHIQSGRAGESDTPELFSGEFPPWVSLEQSQLVYEANYVLEQRLAAQDSPVRAGYSCLPTLSKDY